MLDSSGPGSVDFVPGIFGPGAAVEEASVSADGLTVSGGALSGGHAVTEASCWCFEAASYSTSADIKVMVDLDVVWVNWEWAVWSVDVEELRVEGTSVVSSGLCMTMECLDAAVCAEWRTEAVCLEMAVRT